LVGCLGEAGKAVYTAPAFGSEADAAATNLRPSRSGRFTVCLTWDLQDTNWFDAGAERLSITEAADTRI
jgi:hypothetical protein